MEETDHKQMSASLSLVLDPHDARISQRISTPAGIASPVSTQSGSAVLSDRNYVQSPVAGSSPARWFPDCCGHRAEGWRNSRPRQPAVTSDVTVSRSSGSAYTIGGGE